MHDRAISVLELNHNPYGHSRQDRPRCPTERIESLRYLQRFWRAQIAYAMTHPNILEFEQRRARERQAATQIKDGSAPRSTPIDVDRRERTGTAVRLAAKAGVGEMTMQRAIKVRKQGAPEVQKAVESGEVSLNMATD